MKARLSSLALRTIAAYLIFGVAWMFLFDYSIPKYNPNSNYVTTIQVYEDVVFILMSAVGLGFVLDQELKSRESAEQNYQNIFIHAIDGIFQSTLDGYFTIVNPAMAHLYGYDSPDEMIRQTRETEKRFYADPKLQQKFLKTLRTDGSIEKYESQESRKDGTLFWISMNAHIVKSKNGNPAYIEGFIRDITQHKEALTALSEAERQYRALVEQVPAAIYTDSPENNLNSGIYISPQIKTITGYSAEEWTKTRAFWPNRIHPDDLQFYIDENERTNRTRESFDIEYRIIAKDDRVVWIREFAKLIYDEYGQPLHWQGILLDITDKKHAEKRIEATEESYRTLIEQAADGIFISDPEGNYKDVNSSGCDMLGYSRTEILSMNMRDLIPPEELRTSPLRLREIKSGRILVTQRNFRKKDGILLPVEVSSKSLSDGRLLGIVRDITERIQAEESIRSNDEKLRAIIDNTQNIYYSRTANHLLTYISEQSRNILGYEPEDLLINWKELITEHPINQQGLALGQKALDTGIAQEPYVLELKTRDGQGVWVEARETPVIRDGKVVSVVGALTDITQRKEADERMERQLGELTVVHAVTTAGSQSDSEDEVIEKITQIIGGMLYPDNCGILLLNPDGTILKPHYSYRGIPLESLEEGYPLSNGVTGLVAAHGRPVRIDDVSTEPAYVETTAETHSELCVPIRVKERIIGVLNAESRKLNAFDDEDERLMNTVAGVLGTSIERIRFFKGEQKQRWDAEHLREATSILTVTLKLPDLYENILNALEKIVRYDSASISLITDNETEIVAARGFPKTVTMVGKKLPPLGKWEDIRSSQRPMILDDAQTDSKFQSWEETSHIRGWIGIPMIFEDEVIGFINADSRRIKAYTEEDAALGQTFANQAAIAIKNAFLYKSEQRSHHEAEKLRQASTAVTSSLNLREVLRLLLNALKDVVPFDSASIIMPEGEQVRIVAAQGFPEEWHVVDSVHPAKGRLLQDVLETGQPLIIEDAQLDGHFDKWTAAEHTRGWMAIPMIARGKVIGFLTLGSFSPGAFNPGAAELAQSFAHQASVAIENARLFESLQKTNLDLSLAYDTTLEGWGKALELRDKETQGHTLRVTNLTLKLARLLSCSPEQLIQIRRGTLVHDIGKMGVPDHILHKNGRLTEAEWVEMRKHPQHAFDLLYPIEYLRPALDIAYCHHERWDGSGYPRGLRETQIPLAARIFAIVDVWDALLNERPYRKNGWSKKKTIKYIRDQAGIHFDPEITKVFIQMVQDEQKK